MKVWVIAQEDVCQAEIVGVSTVSLEDAKAKAEELTDRRPPEWEWRDGAYQWRRWRKEEGWKACDISDSNGVAISYEAAAFGMAAVYTLLQPNPREGDNFYGETTIILEYDVGQTGEIIVMNPIIRKAQAAIDEWVSNGAPADDAILSDPTVNSLLAGCQEPYSESDLAHIASMEGVDKIYQYVDVIEGTLTVRIDLAFEEGWGDVRFIVSSPDDRISTLKHMKASVRNVIEAGKSTQLAVGARSVTLSFN